MNPESAHVGGARPVSLLSAHTAASLRTTVQRIAGSTPDKREAECWAESVLSEVGHLDLLLALAHQALAGRSAAAARLCEMLDSVVNESTLASHHVSSTLSAAIDEQASLDRHAPETRLSEAGQDRALNPVMLMTLLAGIAWSARDHAQLQRCFSSLAVAISPIRELERLYSIGEDLRRRIAPPRLLTPMSLGAPPGLPGFDPGRFPPPPIPDPEAGIRGLLGRNAFKKKPIYVEGLGYVVPILSTHRDVASCFMQFLRTLPALQQAAPRYRIESISDVNACAGATITLRGENFGAPGLVIFPAAGGEADDTSLVQASSWSDTEIVVDVPPIAGPGPIELRVRDHDIRVCGENFTLYRLGDGLANFNGGTPTVFSLSVAGQSTGPVVVTPASTVAITWSASQAPDTVVNIVVSNSSGVSIALGPYGGGFGFAALAIPAFSTATALTVAATASSHCGQSTKRLELQATVPAKITIEGLEITQGIQTFRRTDVANNNLPTIAGKDTIVRAYVYADRNGFMNDRVSHMTASLEVDGVAHAPINGQTPAGGSPDPFITFGTQAALNRSNAGATLNFRVPAARCNGTRTLKLVVFGEDELGGRYETYTTTWTWTENEALAVRWVLVRDGRPGGSGQVPTDDEARFTVLRALELLPTVATNIAPAWRSPWNTTSNFADPAGPSVLLDNLDDEHNCDSWESFWSSFDLADCPSPDNALWLGLTSRSSPINRGQANTPGNTAVAMIHAAVDGAGDVARRTPGHEIGHCTGRSHVNRGCGVSAPGGPYFAHPNNGDLLDVPFDPFYNVVVGNAPGSVQCLMSYGCSVWTSELEWTDLLNVI